MVSKEFSIKIYNLESQIKKLTHLVAGLPKIRSLTSCTQDPQTSPQANEKLSSSSKPASASPIEDPQAYPTKETPPSTSCTPESFSSTGGLSSL